MNSPRQFSFVAVRSQSGEAVIRPLLPLVLTSPVNHLAVQGLLDTGADVNVLPYSMGIALGLDWDKQTIAVSLSGNLAQSEARAVLPTIRR